MMKLRQAMSLRSLEKSGPKTGRSMTARFKLGKERVSVSQRGRDMAFAACSAGRSRPFARIVAVPAACPITE